MRPLRMLIESGAKSTAHSISDRRQSYPTFSMRPAGWNSERDRRNWIVARQSLRIRRRYRREVSVFDETGLGGGAAPSKTCGIREKKAVVSSEITAPDFESFAPGVSVLQAAAHDPGHEHGYAHVGIVVCAPRQSRRLTLACGRELGSTSEAHA